MRWSALDVLRQTTLVAALFCAGRARAQDAELDSVITRAMREMKVPGLAVAAVAPGEVLWTRAYGFADVGKTRPVTPRTPRTADGEGRG
jgi:CubicO group peptidase (beta-lactamase class C family)